MIYLDFSREKGLRGPSNNLFSFHCNILFWHKHSTSTNLIKHKITRNVTVTIESLELRCRASSFHGSGLLVSH